MQRFSYYTYHRGGILIEFAFSVPVLIILLLFLCDHYRFYELKNKIKSSAYLAAGILQQLKNTKAEKQLTSSDFQRISFASCLNFFHTDKMFKFQFGVYYNMECAWVKRINNDSYQYQNCYGNTGVGTAPSDMACNSTNISIKTLAQVKAMHSDLECDKDGDERLLIECSYRIYSDENLLGFYILGPKKVVGTINTRSPCFFIHQIVITPKPGLFPAKVR